MLFERLLAAKGLAAIIALIYWSVGWRIEVLLAAERPVSLVALVDWSVGWGVKVLVEGSQ